MKVILNNLAPDGGMIDLTLEELERLYNLTKGNVEALKVLYGQKKT